MLKVNLSIESCDVVCSAINARTSLNEGICVCMYAEEREGNRNGNGIDSKDTDECYLCTR